MIGRCYVCGELHSFQPSEAHTAGDVCPRFFTVPQTGVSDREIKAADALYVRPPTYREIVGLDPMPPRRDGRTDGGLGW
jgi:hypothetical protein